MTQITSGYTMHPTIPFGYANHNNTGVSNDSSYLRVRLSSVTESIATTYLLLKRENALLSALLAAIQAARHDNWDGYGAEPVMSEAIDSAQRFVDALPFDVPLPTIAVEPDGEIAFNWQSAVDQMFSISVGLDEKLSYSGLFGDDDMHGSTFLVNTMPKTVLRAIKKVYAID